MAGDTIPERTLSWLLEEEDPGVRYLAMRDLLGLPPEDAGLLTARKQAHQTGPIAEVLKNMHPEGYWEKAGPGYLPKYRSTVWALTLLGQARRSKQIPASKPPATIILTTP